MISCVFCFSIKAWKIQDKEEKYTICKKERDREKERERANEQGREKQWRIKCEQNEIPYNVITSYRFLFNVFVNCLMCTKFRL